MLLQLVPKLPEGEQWQYEVKWDGYRGIAVISDGEARLWSRNERDLGKRFGRIVDALRSEALAGLMEGAAPPLRFSDTLEGTPDVLVPVLREQGLEGIVAKDTRSGYEAGRRTGKWQKFKLYLEEEFLIGGYIPSGKGGVESVVLGKMEDKQLRYVAFLDASMPLSQSRAAAKA